MVHSSKFHNRFYCLPRQLGSFRKKSQEPDAAFPAAEIGTELGSGIADFSFTTFDGKTYSLYDTLKEKKMVLRQLGSFRKK